MTTKKPQGPCSNIWKNRHLKLTDLEKLYLKDLGGVYFIKSGDFIKIGCTSYDPEKRLKQLQTAHFRKLQIVCVIHTHDPQRIEKLFHLHFSHLLTESKNEWFHLDEELQAFINSQPTRQDAVNFLSKSKFLSPEQKERATKMRSKLRHAKDCLAEYKRWGSEQVQKSEEWGLLLLNPSLFDNDKYLPWLNRVYDKAENFMGYYFKQGVLPWHDGSAEDRVFFQKTNIKQLELLAKKGFVI